MTPRLHPCPLAEPLPRHLARWLLAHVAGASAGDASGALVLVPARRPAAALREALLQESGREAVLLPLILTPSALAGQLAQRLDLAPASLPEYLRPLVLARRLKALDWVRPGSAPGLAEELCERFDELRRHGRAGLLAAAQAGAVSGATPPDELEDQDWQRLRQAWSLYRRAVPRDATDLLLEILARLAGPPWGGPPDRWPLPPRAVAVAAGFAELEPAAAALLATALRQGGAGKAHVLGLEAGDPLSRLLLASWAGPEAPGHPLGPAARAEALLLGRPSAVPTAGSTSATAACYRERLAALGRDAAAPLESGTIAFRPCPDPEAEARTIADIVVRALAGTGGVAEPGVPRILIATADRPLAARIAAHCRDAGIDVEDTAGTPLCRLPAGLLAHALLRAALTDLRWEPLLELLTHPWAAIQGRRLRHVALTLRLEKTVRAGRAAPACRAGLGRLAREHDEAARAIWNRTAAGMDDFVLAVAEALAPLREGADGDLPWRDRIAALRRSWAAVAPDRPLGPEAREGQAPAVDRQALGQLLDDLEEASQLLPATDLAGFASDLERLLGRRRVLPHRSPFLPVRVTGLLEARLEECDLLVLAGMADEVFPGRRHPPLFLADPARRRLELPTWREQLALQAELFLRLLHNGRRLVVTWPRERQGRPCLASSLVARLELARGGLPPADTAGEGPVPLHRRLQDVPPRQRIAAEQAAFLQEPPEVASVAGQPPRRLSHSTLHRYRDCPYAFMVERVFALKPEEEVVAEFGARDFGQTTHACLQAFLAPGGPGDAALARGDEPEARRLLLRAIDDAFGQGAVELPQRPLWGKALGAMAPQIVRIELERRAVWRPLGLEQPFHLGLPALREWLERAGGESRPAAPGDEGLSLTGRIDRIDARLDGPGLAVIDYKTGALPARGDIEHGRELQVALYALALEAGTVGRDAEGLVLLHGREPTPPDLAVPGGFGVAAEGRYWHVSGAGAELSRGPLDDLRGPAGRALLVNGAETILEAVRAAAREGGPYPLVPAHWRDESSARLPCGFCEWRATCRLEERAKPARLASRLLAELITVRKD